MSSKNEARNAKEEGRREDVKAKSKSQDCCVTLLSAHARTSQANILHLDQKAASVQLANGFMAASFSGASFFAWQRRARNE